MTQWSCIRRSALIAALCVVAPVFASWKSELERLVQVERSFSAASQASGVKEAFLRFLADDGTLFRPGPVPGKKWMSERPATAGSLVWRPAFADLSAAGDLGYTTGPYEFRSEQASRNGHYVTIWKKQANGQWRFVLDTGISHPAPDRPIAESWARLSPRGRTSGELSKERSALLELDDEFSAASEEQGVPTAYAAWTTSDARVYRNGHLPAVGRREVLLLLEDSRGTLTWRSEKADVAKSADLGYTWGSYEIKTGGLRSKPQPGYYVRIWKKQSDGSWKVVLDILS